MDTSHRKGSAVALLTKVVASGLCDADQVAAELVTDGRTVGLYIAGSLPMPTDRQLCFAHFLIERVPSMARHGHNLLSQIKAEVSFARSDTVLHLNAPTANSRSY